MAQIEVIQSTPEILVQLGDFLQGPPGPTGPTGQQGAGINFKGQVANYASLPTNPAQNDTYETTDTNFFWVWNGTAWVNLGNLLAIGGLFVLLSIPGGRTPVSGTWITVPIGVLVNFSIVTMIGEAAWSFGRCTTGSMV